jgi:hypothetical protein
MHGKETLLQVCPASSLYLRVTALARYCKTNEHLIVCARMLRCSFTL